VLTGDPFYVQYYTQDYEAFKERLTPEASAALKGLKTKIKDEGRNIVSALLCLYFSATDDQNLSDMLRTVEDSSAMQEALKKTPYYEEEGWTLYESVRPELRTLLTFLQEIGFDDYWHSNILPGIEQCISAFQEELPRFNVIVEDEAVLGSPFPSNKITVYVLHYVQPHGIKVVGARFLTDESYPFHTIVRNAVHELFHPPFDRQSDGVQACISELKNDPFLMETFVNHNPDYGYNTFEGLIEEGCVRTLEQLVNEKLGIAKDVRERWRTDDEGLHVFAACLYSVMKEEHYNEQGELFEAFFVRTVQTKLKPGILEQLYKDFMQSSN
ncbi:MAG TPA: hypothetical protein VFN35_31950, partial [Ktedonobacteraceae bacterium]|nr:hypothetical protein [Ktedonobacteraceae bacterium]